jgi:stage V sporulation protein B
VDKASEMGQTSAVGSLQLFLGRSSSTIILAIGTIVLGLIINEGDYGLYTIAMIPATTFLLFQDWGVGTALTRYCAKYRATNEAAEERKIIVAGLIFEVVTGIVLTVVSILLSSFIAYTIFGKPESALLIAISSITILMTALSSTTGFIFVGFEQMKPSSYTLLIGAIVQSILAPLLLYLGYGVIGAIIGFTLSSVVSAAISLIFLYFFIFRKLPRSRTNKSDIYRTLKPLLKFGIPLSMGTIFSGLLVSFYSFMMASYVSDALIGNYKIATNFTVLLAFFNLPIATVLFPAFSKVDPQTEKNLLKTVFVSSVKYTVLFVVPVTMALIVLSRPLIGTIYGNKWSDAPFLLSLSVIYNLLTLFGYSSMKSLLPALGETKLVMKLNLLSLLISVPLAFLLVPSLGIMGIIIGIPGSSLISNFIGIYIEWKRYGVKADFGSSARILLASSLAAIAVYLFLNFFAAAYWVLFVVGSILFMTVFLISAPIVGAITQMDVNNLRKMFSGLGIMSRLLEIPFLIIERLLKIHT